jgi:hypothetical protein
VLRFAQSKFLSDGSLIPAPPGPSMVWVLAHADGHPRKQPGGTPGLAEMDRCPKGGFQGQTCAQILEEIFCPKVIQVEPGQGLRILPYMAGESRTGNVQRGSRVLT